MRIISQNGKIDVPYEVMELRVFDSTITMCMVGDTGKSSVLAEYGNTEKAQKAMDMLHQEYSGIMPSLVINNNSAFDEKDMEALLESTKGAIVRPADSGDIEVHMLPRVFRFPADDEIEVYHDCSHF